MYANPATDLRDAAHNLLNLSCIDVSTAASYSAEVIGRSGGVNMSATVWHRTDRRIKLTVMYFALLVVQVSTDPGPPVLLQGLLGTVDT